MISLPVAYDHSICECSHCELRSQRHTFVPTQFPQAEWNKLMILAEGPGATEVRTKTPLIGPSGQLLNKLLEAAGIKREECLVGNVTSCQPAAGQKGKERPFHVVLPNALAGCLPRVLTEIAAWQPRVIVALGQAALAALTGEPYEKAVRVPTVCAECGGAGKWARFSCPGCGETWEEPFQEGVAARTCDCGTVVEKEPRNRRCEVCAGRKTRVEIQNHFRSEWSISWVAGGVFDGAKLGLSAKYLIPTYHPSYLLRPAKGRGDAASGGQFLATSVVEHLIKARRLLTEDRQWAVVPRTTQSAEDIATYTQFIGPSVWYDLDIETDSKEPASVTKIKCFGIHRYIEGQGDAPETLVVDTEDLPTSHPAVQMLSTFLADAEAQKEGQNFSIYDVDVIGRVWGFETKGLKFDLLQAHKALYPDEPHDLHHIAFTFSDAAPWKPPRNKGGVEVFDSKEEFHLYNASDCKAASNAARHLRRRLREDNCMQVHDIDLQKALLCRDMNQFGIPIHLERREKIGVDAFKLRDESLAAMRAYIAENTASTIQPPWLARKKAEDRHFNPNAAVDLAWALYAPTGPCKLIPAYRTPTGAPSTEKGALKKYADHPFVKLLKGFRKGKHIVSTFIEGNEVDPWVEYPGFGKLRILWKVGAKTGRYTSSPNGQNWHVDMRWMVVAPPGYKVFGADASQLEFRNLAGVSNDKGMIELLARTDEKRKLEPEYDPHSFVAFHAFGTAYTGLLLKDPSHGGSACRCQTCQRKMLRDVAKRIVYGMSYGGGAPTIRDAIMSDPDYDGPDLSVALVQSVIDAFYRAFPGVRRYQQEKHAKAKEDFEIREPILGRRRVFPFGDVPFTECVNWDQQAGASAIIDLGVKCFSENVPAEADAHLFAIVHDGIYGIARDPWAQACADLLSQAMTCEIQFHPDAPPILFPATGKVGNDWAEVS